MFHLESWCFAFSLLKEFHRFISEILQSLQYEVDELVEVGELLAETGSQFCHEGKNYGSGHSSGYKFQQNIETFPELCNEALSSGPHLVGFFFEPLVDADEAVRLINRLQIGEGFIRIVFHKCSSFFYKILTGIANIYYTINLHKMQRGAFFDCTNPIFDKNYKNPFYFIYNL